MVEFLSKDKITHLLLSYLSRLPKGIKIWDNKYEIKLDEIITDTPENMVGCDMENGDEIRAT